MGFLFLSPFTSHHHPPPFAVRLQINLNQKRYAVVSALAASAVPSLVLARGHRIDSVPEMPLVVSNEAEGIEKTSSAVKLLTRLGAIADVEKAKASKALRPGKGKMRNRRHVMRKGPLVVYGTEGAKLVKAFRNIPGVEVRRRSAHQRPCGGCMVCRFRLL